MRTKPGRWRLAAGLAAAVAACAATPAVAREAKRYGIEGKLRAYDAERGVMRFEVTSLGGSGFAGATSGARPPAAVKTGEEIELGVVPEGAVVKRTVIKASSGGGLDTTGTREGFARAVEAIPRDRSVGVSFERSPEGSDGPPWRAMTIQIPLSPEEIRRRLREIGIDPEELERDAAGGGAR